MGFQRVRFFRLCFLVILTAVHDVWFGGSVEPEVGWLEAHRG